MLSSAPACCVAQYTYLSTVEIVGPGAGRVRPETVHVDKVRLGVDRCLVHRVVADGQRIPVVTADLRVLADEVIKALRVWIPCRSKVA